MNTHTRGTAPTETLTILDSNGNPVSATGTPTYAITDSAGAAVASGNTTAGGTGVYSVIIPATLTQVLDRYKIVWSYVLSAQSQTAVSYYEIVGSFLFSINELRAFDPIIAADTTTYSAAVIGAAREAAEERIELLCRRAFRPRGKRVSLDGTGDADLMLPDYDITSIVSASIDGTALTSGERADLVVYPHGVVRRKTLGSWSAGYQNVSVLYEYGMVQTPEPVRRAAMALARENMVGLANFSRATSESSDVGVLRFSLAGRDGPTGIPEVDAVIAQYGHSRIAIA